MNPQFGLSWISTLLLGIGIALARMGFAGSDFIMASGFESDVSVLVKINELNANISNGCDLVELRALSGGSMQGFELFERTTPVLTFGSLNVQTGDFVVIHLNSGNASCNPGGSGNETSSVNQFPASTFPGNYDFAWDWYSADSGIANTNNVITLYDGQGNIVDAVFVTNTLIGTTAAATAAQAAVVADAGEWTMVGGGVPPGGFVNENFHAHAVQGLDSTDNFPAGTSIQRDTNTDSNTKADWVVTFSSWGMRNAGETP